MFEWTGAFCSSRFLNFLSRLHIFICPLSYLTVADVVVYFHFIPICCRFVCYFKFFCSRWLCLMQSTQPKKRRTVLINLLCHASTVVSVTCKFCARICIPFKRWLPVPVSVIFNILKLELRCLSWCQRLRIRNKRADSFECRKDNNYRFSTCLQIRIIIICLIFYSNWLFKKINIYLSTPSTRQSNVCHIHSAHLMCSVNYSPLQFIT